MIGDSDKVVEEIRGGGGHQAEIYVGSAGRIAPTTASGCGYSGSGPSSGSGSSGVGEFVTASVGGNADSTGGRGFTARISSKVRPHGGGAAWIAVPRDAMDVEMRSSSVSYVMQPQLVPSRISVVLVEETEVRGAECLASGPVDKVVRWSAGETCPSSGTGCMAGAMMPGAVGTLSPSISNPVDPVGPCGTLSPSEYDSVGPCGTLFPSDSDSVGPLGPYGTLSPSDPDYVGPVGPYETLSQSDFDSVGPVGPCGTLSPSDPDSVGHVGPYGTLSPSDSDYVGHVGLYGTLSPSDSDPVSPVGPVGTLSPSDLESGDPVGPVGKLSLFNHVDRLSPFAPPVGEMSSVDPVRGPPGD